ncbi:MAG: hypothetical protein ACKV19_24305 [Verrucomicrobiales bacterium]
MMPDSPRLDQSAPAPPRQNRLGLHSGFPVFRRSFFPFGHLLAALALWLGALAPAHATQSLAGFDEERGASRIQLTAVFSPPPPSGYLPVAVEITNATGAKRSWRLEFSSQHGHGDGNNRMRSSFEVTADPGGSQSTLLVPLQARHRTSRSAWYGGGYHVLDVSVTSGQGGRHSTTSPTETTAEFPAIAISDALAVKSLTQLNDALKNHGSGSSHRGGSHGEVFGSRFAPDRLPDQWLGYSGFDHLLITTDEWLAASPGVRSAVLQAAQFGLHLHFYRNNSSTTLASLGLTGTSSESSDLPLGMGHATLVDWNGDSLDATPTVDRFLSLGDRALMRRLTSDFARGSWGLMNALGERNFAGWQVIVFLLLFGVLIGPINLFVLAPAGRRHRLFFTTPVISLVSSILLVILILFQDGTGGQGRRFIAVHLPPGQAAAHVTQEQVARTGVLLGSSFELPRPTEITQAVLRASPWTKFSDDHSSQSMDTRLDGLRTSGNWFQSRTVQAQFLRSLVPTRGRIDLVPPNSPGDPPTIVSSLETELASFSYLDAQGTIWRAEGPVTQGRPVALIQDTEAWRNELNRISQSCTESLAARIADVVLQRPAFLATAQSAPGLAIDTLPAIDWIDDRIVIFGNLPATP